MENGWIKLYRSFLDWEWFDDARMVHVWLFLLCSASRQDDNWRGQYVKRGQIITSVKSIAKKCSLSEQNVRTIIKRLKSTGEITSETTNNFTIITICKYDDYQKGEELVDGQNNKPTNKQLTNDQQTTNERLTTSKEYKKIRSKEYIKRSSKEDPKNKKCDPLEVEKLEESNQPLKKQKNEKEKSCAKKEKANIAQRQEEFMRELTPYVDTYGKTMVRNFYDYWSEPTQGSVPKMKKELQHTWATANRLRTWKSNETKFNNGTTATDRQPNGSSVMQRPRATPELRAREYAAGFNDILASSESTAPRL